MKITNQKNVEVWQIDGLPPGEYDLTVTASNSAGTTSTTVHESIPGPPVVIPEIPVVEPLGS